MNSSKAIFDALFLLVRGNDSEINTFSKIVEYIEEKDDSFVDIDITSIRYASNYSVK